MTRVTRAIRAFVESFREARAAVAQFDAEFVPSEHERVLLEAREYDWLAGHPDADGPKE